MIIESYAQILQTIHRILVIRGQRSTRSAGGEGATTPGGDIIRIGLLALVYLINSLGILMGMPWWFAGS